MKSGWRVSRTFFGTPNVSLRLRSRYRSLLSTSRKCQVVKLIWFLALVLSKLGSLIWTGMCSWNADCLMSSQTCTRNMSSSPRKVQTGTSCSSGVCLLSQVPFVKWNSTGRVEEVQEEEIFHHRLKGSRRVRWILRFFVIVTIIITIISIKLNRVK